MPAVGAEVVSPGWGRRPAPPRTRGTVLEAQGPASWTEEDSALRTPAVARVLQLRHQYASSALRLSCVAVAALGKRSPLPDQEPQRWWRSLRRLWPQSSRKRRHGPLAQGNRGPTPELPCWALVQSPARLSPAGRAAFGVAAWLILRASEKIPCTSAPGAPQLVGWSSLTLG